MGEPKGFMPPRSPEGRASVVPAPPWHYSGDLLTIEYRTDPDAVTAWLPAALEPAEEATRRGQRDADPGGDRPDPGPVAALAEHQERTPLGERELEAGVSQGECPRGEADGAHGNPLQIGRERVHGGEMPGRGARCWFVDAHPAQDDR